MKKIVSMIIGAAAVAVLLAGCGAKKPDLVSREPFPEFSETDMEGNDISNHIFADYDVTIVNFWNNGCGTCIEEMPELEEMYQDFKEQNVNLIGVGADSGESEEQLVLAQSILKEKGVTYQNISPNPENDFYKDFISKITGYPTTYLVDNEGNIVGAPIIGNVKKQLETVQNRIDSIKGTGTEE